ncbi:MULTISPECIES: hypothetical protein [Acinetobacter]|uniref:DUF7660 family protein n=1 Tax=Acinetobacter TaxID=469 RepID=UPI0022E5DE47|nr:MULTISPECIES: hypothetical protein [Acinetobacter]MDI1223631.1 hypothetical protein [Acinetobacter sp.]
MGKKDLQSFLAAIHNWVEDMEGFYANTQQPQPEHMPWKIFADILMAGKSMNNNKKNFEERV